MLRVGNGGERMSPYVLEFREIDREEIAQVGGKAAHLGELMRLDGLRVPPGYCVTTRAFERILAGEPSIDDRLERLSRLDADDLEGIRELSGEIRRLIEEIVIADDLAAAIIGPLARFGESEAYAVRSSATAEDLPTASFAGQQDTYLNVVGAEAVLEHVRKCWASLFTERAVSYRLRNGFDHRKVRMAVVVQRMVLPQASGVLFTADPVTGNRKVASVEATFGLGEALVSGLVNADVFKVRSGEIVGRQLAAKRVETFAAPRGGTENRAIAADRQEQPALTDEEVVRLVELGRRIEAHFGSPQDIEWCLADGDFHVVQSRPITTLFPVPVAGDGRNRVYVSVGHQQMMTDAMKPLGISFWQLTAGRPMFEAAGRLFVDVTDGLASPVIRPGLLDALGRSDPLIGDALQTILDRDDFISPLPAGSGGAPPAGPPPGVPVPLETSPAVVAELIERTLASVAATKRLIAAKSGPELLDFIQEDVQELKRILFDPQSHRVLMAAMDASRWLNEKLHEWLGEKNVADPLTQSAPGNVTSEMGLALLKVADAIRPHPNVVAHLQQAKDDDFLEGITEIEGGPEAREAILAFLQRYGMRCVGEIDITRPRWSERPSTLLPLILGNVQAFEAGEGERRFEQGRQEAQRKESEVLERLRALPEGERKAEEAKQMIDRVRTFIGYREFPKYGMVARYFVYKQALMEEAARLVSAGVLSDEEDIFFLTFQELQEVVRTSRLDEELIRRRKDAHRSNQALLPPRVLTSDGEAVVGRYRRDDVPAGALVGLAVSAGTIEGRARVVLDMAKADLRPGDILVTAYTDPSWTPLFLSIGGLVTEVGGLMTHGAVIAREYGLPAVVGVENATRLIRDGQRIRVHGTEGYVEILAADR